MPVIAYFLIAFAVFLVLLAITWSFRNTAAKVGSPRRAPGAGTARGHDTDGHQH
ncbi:hypothetical protein FHX52_1525 [Humibacillus xanthopallidus]|uniref:Uncharacterized protein n=1 Tax=Humibacillus xanthopallidus TaxID=412689 RepID=A0A543PWD5_9MICO|nr:hypothetical protein [Humibacillus xanthopallidus]TQN48393.1 hypothetical protein FHX52_1525 [Humibacillus xanthopallidus]